MISASKARLGGPWRRIATASVLFGMLSLTAAMARADDGELRTAARDLATQGAEAFDAQRFEQAADFFRRAYELVPAPSIALMRARSLVKVGRLLQATDVYEQTVRSKLAPDAPDAYVSAVESARTEVEEVRQRVPHLKLSLSGEGPHEALTVTIDDKPTPSALLGVDQPIDPGAHVLVAKSGKTVRASRDVTFSEGEHYVVELDVGKPMPAAAAPESGAFAVGHSPHSSVHASPPVLGYVALGVSALGLAIGTYSGVVALHHKSQLDAACHPTCPPSSRGDLDGFRSNRTVSWISYGVGIAAGAAGVLLITIGSPGREQATLRVVPGGLAFMGRL